MSAAPTPVDRPPQLLTMLLICDSCDKSHESHITPGRGGMAAESRSGHVDEGGEAPLQGMGGGAAAQGAPKRKGLRLSAVKWCFPNSACTALPPRLLRSATAFTASSLMRNSQHRRCLSCMPCSYALLALVDVFRRGTGQIGGFLCTAMDDCSVAAPFFHCPRSLPVRSHPVRESSCSTCSR